MKRPRIVLAAVAAAVLVAALFLVQRRNRSEGLRIGAILPLTGNGALYGDEAKDGMDLALAGLKGQKIEVLYEDDYGTADGAVSAFNKLVIIDKVPVVIGAMFSSTALAVVPIAKERKVILFSPSASSPALTGTGGGYFFRNWPSDVYEGGEMAKFAWQKLKLQKIAILSVNLDYGTGLTQVFTRVFKSLGGQIIDVEYYNQGATDFRAQLTKIKSENPEAVYLPGYYTEIGLILRQAKELGIRTQFLSCVGFDNPEVLKIGANAANGVIFARPSYNPDSNDPRIKSFVGDFVKKYVKRPGIYAATAYDALNTVAEAVGKGGTSVDGIRAALLSIKD